MTDGDIIAAAADDQRKAERELLGRLNYETYAASRDWKAYNGEPIPQWEDERLPEHIREALLRMWNDFPAEGDPWGRETTP